MTAAQVSATASAAGHAAALAQARASAVTGSLIGLLAGQLVIAVLGALTITSEYSTGMIRTSLIAMPRRGTWYAAKALVFGAVALVAGMITSFASFFAGQAVLSGVHASASLSQPGVLRAVIGAACAWPRGLRRRAVRVLEPEPVPARRGRLVEPGRHRQVDPVQRGRRDLGASGSRCSAATRQPRSRPG